MKRLIQLTLLLLLPAFVLVAAVPPANSVAHAAKVAGKAKPDWNTYSSAAGKFKIKFPGRTEISEEDKEKATTYKVSAEYMGATYFVGFTLHNQEMPNPESLADVSLEAFTNTLNGKIVSNSPWKIKKNLGREATIRLAEKDAIVRYRVVIVDQIQYQLVVISTMADYDDKIAGKFLKSFKLTK